MSEHPRKKIALDSAAFLKQRKEKRPRYGRTLLLLLVAAVLAFGLYYVTLPVVTEMAEQESALIELISREKSLLDTITVDVSGEAPYTLKNVNDYDLSDANDVIGEEYKVVGQDDFDVSTAQVLSMELYSTSLSATEKVTDDPKDLREFGLSEPDMTIIIGYRDGTDETLYFGGKTPTGIGYYLRKDGDPAVYVVSYTVYEAYHRALSELEKTEEEKAAYAELNSPEPESTSAPAPSESPSAFESTGE